MFKLGLILLDKPLRRLEQRGNGPWLFFGAVVLGFAIRALWPAFNYITERFFYMGIILMGYIFALLHHGRISKAKCALLQGVNLALMLFSLQMTQVGIDNGYIVSALYAAVLFGTGAISCGIPFITIGSWPIRIPSACPSSCCTTAWGSISFS